MIRQFTMHYYAILLAIFSTASSAESTQEEFPTTNIQKDVHLVLEPSLSRIQAVTLYLESPGRLDLSQLKFADGVEYAVVPVEFMNQNVPHTTVSYGKCDEQGCDFTPDTDWILEMGVGAKVNDDDTYLWCDNSAMPHLIRNNSSVWDGSPNDYGEMIMDVWDPSESGYYAILMANCQEDDGDSLQVEGTLAWTNTRQELSFFQAALAPLALVGILALVYYTKEKEGRLILSQDSYNASARNAGYMSLPMMDLQQRSSRRTDNIS